MFGGDRQTRKAYTRAHKLHEKRLKLVQKCSRAFYNFKEHQNESVTRHRQALLKLCNACDDLGEFTESIITGDHLAWLCLQRIEKDRCVVSLQDLQTMFSDYDWHNLCEFPLNE